VNVIDLFSGIGGFSLGLERARMQTIQFCEIDPYCRKVLAKHWPEVPCHDDIKTYIGTRGSANVICGGFPCQDISITGKQKGIDGERSGLWAELRRIIGDVLPQYAIVENVPNLLSGNNGRWFGKVIGDLATLRYDAEWHCIPASAIGAPHQRDRVWIIAYPHENGEMGERLNRNSGHLKRNAKEKIQKRKNFFARIDAAIKDARDALGVARLYQSDTQEGTQRFLNYTNYWRVNPWDETKPRVCRMDDGIPNRVDRLEHLGNSIVPQIAEIIGQAILNAEAA
jgi:DNA (cytosine-5)-methyltransferase 1